MGKITGFNFYPLKKQPEIVNMKDIIGINLSDLKLNNDSYLKKIIQKIDDYTSPRETTAGNYEKFSNFQTIMHAAPAGYALFNTLGSGLLGALSATASACLGGYVQEKTGSNILGILTGGITGAVSGGLLGSFGGPAGTCAGIVNGLLLGVLMVFRGDAKASVRDTAGNSLIISGLFVPGTGKIAGGIAAAIAEKIGKSNKSKALIGAGVGALAGGILAAAGFSPVGLPVAVAASAAAGAIGPYIGLRFSQLFRNLSQDIGNSLEKYLKKHKVIKGELDQEVVNSLGAFPASLLKEGIRSSIYSDGSPLAVLFSSICETLELVHMFLVSKGENSSSKKTT